MKEDIKKMFQMVDEIFKEELIEGTLVETLAKVTARFYRSFKNEGFSDKESLELTLAMINKLEVKK